MKPFTTSNKLVRLYNSDVSQLYEDWDPPVCIVSDGPYGIEGYRGDLLSHEGLGRWYEPHIRKWSERSTPETTLWFWNTEIGWAVVHPVLEANGWDYVHAHVWDKGKAHIAGNINTRSIRSLPVVTELCVQYVKRVTFMVDGHLVSMKKWLHHEWKRTGIPFSRTNEACGVKDAATRKYFTLGHLWYIPPIEAFEKIAAYANKHGKPEGKPYFSLDGEKPLTKNEWSRMRTKFKCPFGVTNVWSDPPVNGRERLKNKSKSIHLNQKPLRLMRLLIEMTTDPNDLVWEPFGGLCSASLAAHELGRRAVAAEIDKEIFEHAVERFLRTEREPTFFS